MAIEREAHLQILIDGSKGAAGAKKIEDALDRVTEKAAAALAKIEALNKVKVSSVNTPRSSGNQTGTSSAQSSRDATNLITGERSLTAAVQAESTKRIAILRREMASRGINNARAEAIAGERRFTESMLTGATRRIQLGRDEVRQIFEKTSALKAQAKAQEIINSMRPSAMRLPSAQEVSAVSRRGTQRMQGQAAIDREQNPFSGSAAESSFVGNQIRMANTLASMEEKHNAAQLNRVRSVQAIEQRAISERITMNRRAYKIEEDGIQSVMRLRQRMADQRRRQDELAARAAERARKEGSAPASSSLHVGPLSETTSQASRRQTQERASRMASERERFGTGPSTLAAQMRPTSFSKGLSGLNADIAPKANFKFDGAVKEVDRLRNSFGRLQDSVISLNGFLTSLGVGVLARDIINTGQAFQSMDLGLKVATGSAEQGQKEMARLREESNRLGVDLIHMGKEYVNFTAAVTGSNVDIEKAKDSFFAVAQAMALLGRSEEGAARAFKALEQFASKGSIMSEELKGQLAEQLPGAFAITAKALGMTSDELGKAMEKGSVSAKRFFEVFADAVKEKFPVEGQLNTATAAFGRFKNAMNEFKNNISKSGFMDSLAKGAEDVARFLNSIEGKKLASELGVMLKGAVEALVTGFKFLAEHVDEVKLAVQGFLVLKIAEWLIGIATSVAAVGASLVTFVRLIGAHPILAFASALFLGAAALIKLNESMQSTTASSKAQIKALEEIKGLQEKVKNGMDDEKKAARERAAEIIKTSKAVQSELEKELKQRQDLIEAEKAVEKRSQIGGQSTFGPMQGDNAATTYNTAQVEQNIKNEKEKQRKANLAIIGGRSASSQAGTFEGRSGNSAKALREFENQTIEIEKQIKAANKLSKEFENSAEAALKIKRELELASTLKGLEFKISPADLEAMAELEKRIAEARKKINDNPGDSGNTALGADIAMMQNKLSAMSRIPTGKMFKAQVDEVEGSLRRFQEAKDMVAAGPFIQTTKSETDALKRLADAHKKGTDAARDEKNSQEARNKVVELGIDITGAAADRIHDLIAAHNQASELEAINLKVAGQERELDANKMTANILDTTQGPARIAALAQFPAQIAAGNKAGPRPENVPFLNEGRIALSNSGLDTKRDIENAQIEGDALNRELKSGPKKTLKAAQDAGRADAIGKVRQQKNLGRNAPLSAEDQALVEQEAKNAGTQWQIQQQNKTGKSGPNFAEKMRELKESIEAEGQLAAAYGESAEAVARQTRQQEIMNKVHGLSEKLTKEQKGALEGLIGTLYDAETATKFEGAKMDLRNEIDQIETMAQKRRDGVDAVNAETVAQMARDEAIKLGVSANADAVQSLEELFEKRLRIQQLDQNNQDIFNNEQIIIGLQREADALDLVGEARVRRLAEIRAEQDLLSRGQTMNSPGAQESVQSAGNVAVSQFNSDNEKNLSSINNQIDAVGRMESAYSLFGEERIRFMAEAEKEAELIQANGAAVDEHSQKMIEAAGNYAVAQDRLARLDDSLNQLANSGMNFNQQMRDVAAGGLGSLEDALVDIVTGTKSVKEAFADMARAIAADLARMAIRQAIIAPLAMALSFGMGGGAGVAAGAATSAGAGFIGPMPAVAHTGGVMGVDSFPTRQMPRFHTGGIAGNEMPSILKKGEGVFTEGQMAALGPAGGGSVNNFNVSVNQPAGATKEQGDQFGRAIARQMEAMVDEKLRRAVRPGGQYNQGGMS